jgi:hypothetical protein
MPPEENPALREATRLFYEQVLATRRLRTEVEGLERRRAAGEAVDEAGLAAKRAGLAAAAARRDALDRDVAAAVAPQARTGVTHTAMLTILLRSLLREAGTRDRLDAAQSEAAEAEMTRLIATGRSVDDVRREFMAFLDKHAPETDPPDETPT